MTDHQVTDEQRSLVEKAVAKLLAEHPPATTSATEFLGAQYDAGLAWVHFEPGFGGLGLSPALQPIIRETLHAAGAPNPNGNYVGVHQGAATVHEYAATDLKQRWLRPAFTLEEWWCQLFSEPGAGSDLAGLATSAIRDGDEWVVNGQKVWTSFAHKARWAILLARTDPHVPKHRGLTFFIVDMHSPGIEVRPIHRTDGGREFNEVFLSDVRVPDTYRMGDIGQGWGVSVFMLGSEREGMTDSPLSTGWLLDAWRNRRPLGDAEAAYRDQVARLYIANEVSGLLTLRTKELPDKVAAALAPALKVSRTETDQATADLVMSLLGAAGTLGGNYDWEERGEEPSDSLRFVRRQSDSIGGGMNSIMRNLIGERLLGLPGDIRVDKNIPWNEVRRS